MAKLEFKVSTGLKNIIGRELITDDDIAIFELVKNAYDANAKKVKIIFQNLKESSNEKPSKVLIVDDGDGMSYNDIENKWLFVGYSEKKDVQNEEDYRHKIKKHGRFLAGYKGIGRFSSDRLGPRLNLYTKKVDEDIIHTVEMDWRNFEKDQTKEFETVNVEYHVKKELPISNSIVNNFKKGTILEIFPLRDSWDESKLLHLRRYLERLINPSQHPDNRDFSIELIAKDFEKNDERIIEEAKKKDQVPQIINGLIHNVVFEKLQIKTTQMSCEINGNNITTELIDKGKFIFKLKEDLEPKYSKLNNIFIRVFYLNEEAKTAFTSRMGLQPVRYGSIFLYKNGFRIHPYGDEGNDWLGLELRKAQGYARYLATREVIGRIEVYGNQPGFNEVSSRSGGVVKSTEYEQLIKFFIEKVLRRLERYVGEGIYWDAELEETGKKKSENEIRRDSIKILSKLVGSDKNKIIDVNKDLYEILKDRQQENIPQLLKNVEIIKKHIKSPQAKKYLEKQIKSVRNATRTFSLQKRQQDRQIEILQKETLFLKKTVDEKEQLENLYHSINISSQLIEAAISEINEEQKEQKIEKILPLIDEISIENQKIKSLYYVAKHARFKMMVDDKPEDLVAYIREYIQMIFKRRSLKLNYLLENENIVMKTTFIPLEISMILDNLISNSSKVGAKRITLRFQKIGNKLHLYVGDDGSGIPKKIEDKIFERGFSTSPGGSGIGLHHVRSILASHHGNIKFIGNNVKNMGRGACFEVTFW